MTPSTSSTSIATGANDGSRGMSPDGGGGSIAGTISRSLSGSSSSTSCMLQSCGRGTRERARSASARARAP
eukprot:6211100-Prymnesium_polylepis.1